MSISFNICNKSGVNPVQNNIATSKINPNFCGVQKDVVCIKENAADKILYNGILNYITSDSLSAINPFSEYRIGILEKEAYKENPWYTMLI